MNPSDCLALLPNTYTKTRLHGSSLRFNKKKLLAESTPAVKNFSKDN